MSLNAAALRLMQQKGLSLSDVIEIAEAMGQRTDRTNAERQARHRARKRNAVTVTPAAPNEYISNPENPSEAKASPSPVEVRLVDAWNAGAAANGARRAAKLDASRKSLLKARLRDHSEAEVFGAMANLAASKFHCGENDRGWRANLGWFLEAKNFLKALEMGGVEPAKPEAARFATPEARAAYLAELEEEKKTKPWLNRSTPPPESAPRAGKPLSFGTLVSQITSDIAA